MTEQNMASNNTVLSNEQSAQIVVMGGGQHRLRFWAIVVAVVLVVVGIIFGLVSVNTVLKNRSSDIADVDGYVERQLSYEESVSGVAKEQTVSRAINTDTTFVKYYGKAADSLEAQDYKQAIVFFEKAGEAPGTKPSDYYVQMAAAYDGDGQNKRAVDAIKKAKEVYVSYEASGLSKTAKNDTLEGYDMLLEEYSQ